MSSDVCLLVIYNHRFDQNIDKIEKIYKSRFTDIYHIIPFYEGKKENVISVYECSFRFEGYVAQALRYIKKEYRRYFFIADDIMLNPEINEFNYTKWFDLREDYAYITFTKPIHEMGSWTINREFMNPLPKFERYNGTLWKSEIMSAEKAFNIAENKGFSKEDFCIDLGMIWNARKSMLRYPRLFVLFFKIVLLGKQYCPYPLWGGYSDIFIIPGKYIKDFAHMLGVFAAMGLFVEMAIPTAMNLVCEGIVEERNLTTKAKMLWSNEERDDVENKYQHDYKKLIYGWEEKCLFIHPVKLSRWKI